MDNKKMIIAVAAAVLITGILAGGITYGVLSARFSKENDTLSKRLAVLEAAAKKPKAKTTKADSIQTEAQAEETKYGEWLTYTNAEIGYTIRYPKEWTCTVSTEQIDGAPVKNVGFMSPSNGYYLTIGLRVKGSDTLLTARTGLGQGELRNNGTVSVLGVDVKKSELVYQDKVKTIFYGEAGAPFEAQGYQGLAEFSTIGSTDYESYDLAGASEGITADKIVSSLKITK